MSLSDLNLFSSITNKLQGHLPSSKFMVDITPPKCIIESKRNQTMAQAMSMFCSATSLPGLAIATDDRYMRYGYGRSIKTPYNAITNDLDLRFYIDNVGYVTDYFNEWMYNIVPATFGQNGNYLVSYPVQYETTITIKVLSPSGDVALEYTLHKAFPTYVGEVSLDWANSSQLAMLPVRICYQYYTMKAANATQKPEPKKDDKQTKK